MAKIRTTSSVVFPLCGILLAVGWVLFLGGTQAKASPTRPEATVHYVAPGGNCGGVSPCYSTVQAAVNAAQAGDIIKVAQGTYTGVHHVASLDTTTFTATQVVAITESVTIQGGYTTSNWSTPDPTTHFTTLDAEGQGRVLLITGEVTPTIEGVRLTGGDATGLGGSPWGDGGGGVYVVTATATLRNVTVFSNTAPYGGGLYLAHSDTRLLDSAINSNGGISANGGGVYLYYCDGARLAGNSFAENWVGANGGGLFLLSSDAIIERNTIISNTAGYEAGGIRLATSAAILRANLIAANQAGYGGGLSLFAYGDQPTFEGNRILSNTASVRGGGIYFNYLSPAMMVNNVIADNYSPQGSGLYVRDSSPQLLHTTIARNRGGPGVVITSESTYFDSSVAMTNTIIFSHTVGITVTVGNTATLKATLWQDNSTNWSGNVLHTYDYNGDPAFSPDGYHLTSSSAAKERGVNAGVTTDIDGDRRPFGAGYDLGADEYVMFIYLPLVMR